VQPPRDVNHNPVFADKLAQPLARRVVEEVLDTTVASALFRFGGVEIVGANVLTGAKISAGSKGERREYVPSLPRR
jgi:hypothetical protein